MKKSLTVFTLMLLFSSLLLVLSTNLQKESENARSEVTPLYQDKPFNLFLDTQIHGEMENPPKLFLHKVSLKQIISKTKSSDTSSDPYIAFNTDRIKQNFLESDIFLPAQMAKLDVEIFVQNFVFVKSGDALEKIDLELYIGNTRLAVRKLETYKGNFVMSIHLSGTAYNVPAGMHKIYIKVITLNQNSSKIAFRRHSDQDSNGFYEENDPSVHLVGGYLEVVGFPLI